MRRIQLNKVTYTGGHPSHPNPGKGLVVVVDDEGIHVRRFSQLFVIPWNGVTAVSVEGPEQAEKRLTLTRVATIGVFALGAKKTTSAAYLFVQTGGYDVGFEIPGTSAGKLRGQLAPWTSRIASAGSPAVAAQAPPAPAPVGPPAGWYADPHGSGGQRWWDGTTWTDHVQHAP